MLSSELSYSRGSITPFGITGDDMCGLVGVAVGELSRSIASPSSSRVVNSVTVCLLSPTLHQSHFSSSNTTSLLTQIFSCAYHTACVPWSHPLCQNTLSFGLCHQAF